jgi:hypothetical protein
MRFGFLIAAGAALFASAPAQAGLVNPTSTVNPFYEFPPDGVAASGVFNTAAHGPVFPRGSDNPPDPYYRTI